jgi:transposase
MVSKAQRDIRRKTRVLEHAAQTGNVRQTCWYFGIPRSLFYVWKAAYAREGAAGLVNKKTCARAHPKATAPAIVEQILHLRRTYHLGPVRIAWYLARYHGIQVCDATVYRTLKRHGLNRLPHRVGRGPSTPIATRGRSPAITCRSTIPRTRCAIRARTFRTITTRCA